ncbi:MAG: nicotinamide-nucleotide adenylyltransferase, partial [Nitrososphaeraceae archaeon]
VPIFHVLYSGNDFVAGLASREVKIKKPSFLKKDEYNGTNIRKQIATMQQQNWKSLLPNAVCTIIEEIGGVKRIEILAGSDSYPQQW